jgi:mannosylglucosylglycerate synthase
VSPPSASVVSFRLGCGDGVSNEAAKWAAALRTLGFEVTTLAGDGTADRFLPGLAIDAQVPPRRAEVEEALAGCDLVVVENLCSLPLNPGAASVVAEVLVGRRALMHHHDLPWQRPLFAERPPPPDDRGWVHVTINQMSRRQLAARGIQSVVVRNTFDVDPPVGDRDETRRSIGASAGSVVVLQPTRAIPRKNVQGAIALCEALGATFWLLGPAEDGFGPQLERLLERASCPVIRGHAPGMDPSAMADAYAACDVVALPSTWEGFGNPAIESAIHRRPLAIGHYPVATELAAFGFRWFASDDPQALGSWLSQGASEAATLLEHNHTLARRHFSVSDLPGRLARVMEEAGWEKW